MENNIPPAVTFLAEKLKSPEGVTLNDLGRVLSDITVETYRQSRTLGEHSTSLGDLYRKVEEMEPEVAAIVKDRHYKRATSKIIFMGLGIFGSAIGAMLWGGLGNITYAASFSPEVAKTMVVEKISTPEVNDHITKVVDERIAYQLTDVKSQVNSMPYKIKDEVIQIIKENGNPQKNQK